MAQGLIPSVLAAGAFPYLEYGWVCAPNAAGQSITANTITTLTLDTEVQDLGGHGSIAGNQVTLAAGTYYFEAKTDSQYGAGGNYFDALFRLYNVTDSLIVTADKSLDNFQGTKSQGYRLNGQFTIGSSKAFRLEWACSGFANVIGTGGNAAFTIATAGADQRTTLKLWKLA
jgi:hypothetical protein